MCFSVRIGIGGAGRVDGDATAVCVRDRDNVVYIRKPRQNSALMRRTA